MSMSKELREMDSNHRPQGYEPCELPLLYLAMYEEAAAILPHDYTPRARSYVVRSRRYDYIPKHFYFVIPLCLHSMIFEIIRIPSFSNREVY